MFEHNIITVIWDFDKTLIPGYMQEPIFNHYKVISDDFWKEVRARQKEYFANDCLVSNELVYLNHILDYVKDGQFKGLNNQRLRTLGAELEFHPGVLDFFEHSKTKIQQDKHYQKHNIQLEHYVVSAGLRQIILGSQLQTFLSGVWGCEFIEENNVLAKVSYMIDHTTKTRAIFEINKGVNKHPDIDVNASMLKEQRRVPISQMIYVADGPSDVPVFSVINRYGGRNFAVYPLHTKNFEKARNQVWSLQSEGRVQGHGRADYSKGTDTYAWLMKNIIELADTVVKAREETIRKHTGQSIQHT